MNDDYNFNRDEIDIFAEIQQLNYLLKRIQQISWHYDQFNKRYGLQNDINPEQYASILRSLDNFLSEAREVTADYEKRLGKK